MLAVELKRWYKYFLYASIVMILTMSALQLVSAIRVFSIFHIMLCISIVAAAFYSLKYFRQLIKIWASILMFSGGMILLSTMIYLLSGTLNKISLEGNAIGLLTLVIGAILFKYLDSSILPAK